MISQCLLILLFAESMHMDLLYCIEKFELDRSFRFCWLLNIMEFSAICWDKDIIHNASAFYSSQNVYFFNSNSLGLCVQVKKFISSRCSLILQSEMSLSMLTCILPLIMKTNVAFTTLQFPEKNGICHLSRCKVFSITKQSYDIL